MRIFKWKKLVSLMLVGVFCGSAISASAFADGGWQALETRVVHSIGIIKK